ncbi:metal ABC transporter substrate-binding protein [Nocardioides sp. J54]|uniref:metal ABC transporter substrate-binding protein n=1 Tax=Nocardioides sp. J54 TaxID=935866 RepID=UPI00048DCEC0|nr:metal ABC transporter substrate-binding protein [Nocardioides sp. J54]
MRFGSGLALLSSAALLASGCSAFSEDGGSASGGSGTSVVAAFYPLAWLTERVAEGTGTEVELLTTPGAEPHDLELDVQRTALVSQADLVVYQAGFQPAVDDTVAQNAQGSSLDVAALAGLLPMDESAEEHEEHGEHGDEDGHDHGDLDPHFWQDPVRVATVADAVAGELAAIDEEHAEEYAANAAALREDLEALDASYAAGLADCERDTIVVSHDAFGYLEKYGLHIASIVGLSPDAEPTAAVLGRLQDLIEEEGITTVFSEPLEPALGESLAGDLGLTNGVLDPVEGLSDADSGEDYLSIMEANLAALQTANGCR